MLDDLTGFILQNVVGAVVGGNTTATANLQPVQTGEVFMEIWALLGTLVAGWLGMKVMKNKKK